MKRFNARAAALAVGGLLGACSFAPRYHEPSTPAPPPAYQESGDWQTGTAG